MKIRVAINKSLLLIVLLVSTYTSMASEGMWLPHLLKSMNIINDMQTNGMELTQEEIYSVNNSSLKDAIVSFGGFCTAEVISPNGLILTNHHCGYGRIQSHSTVENDYLTNGFWAMKPEEELKNPGLTATFIVRIDEVTDTILLGTDTVSSEESRNRIIRQNIKEYKASLKKKDSLYDYVIKPFFYGNKYYMFTTETFKDVRLVGAPPSAIGKFGGDTDNWMWPRHTGDFSIFRIYADKNNRPAEYSENNVPYKPRHFLPISVKGVQKGDFTMVFGFPGRTQEYLTSYAVEYIMNEANPARIDLRETRLNIMDKDMKADHAVWIKYAAKYARVSNYHKKWIGENRGLKRLNAIEEKRAFEEKFKNWSGLGANSSEYGSILDEFKKAYEDYNQLFMAQEYLYEAGFAMEIFKMTFLFRDITRYMEGVEEDKKDSINFDQDTFDKKKLALIKSLKKAYKDYNAPTDKKIVAAMLEKYYEGVPEQFRPGTLDEIKREGFQKFTDRLFAKSVLADSNKALNYARNLDKKFLKRWKKDPAYWMTHGIYKHYRENVAVALSSKYNQISVLSRKYIKGIMAMQEEEKFYPDANSTLRITHGVVDSYSPKDGVKYKPYTTLKGIIEKGEMGVYDYVVPDKLKELYDNKDYGAYADPTGFLPVCFTASNHTTGGNSGSPVIDANGNLIGLNFDRNWEGTMSDIMYDPDMCRNIAVDVRYILFVVDKFAGAGYLVEEMTLVK